MLATSFDLLTEDGASVVRDAEGEIAQVSRTDRLSRPNRLSFEIPEGPARDAYTERRILRIQYDSHPTEFWRIMRRTHDRGQSGRLSFEARPRWEDLGDNIAYIELADGTKLTGVTVTRVAIEDALTRILSADLNGPSEYTAGSVASSLQGEIVSVFGEGISTQQLLNDAVEQLGARWTATWDDANGQYVIDVVERKGDADATKRVITDRTDDPIQGQPNVRRITEQRDAQDYFSRLVPLGGPEGQRQTIADATWPVESASYDSGPDETTLVLDGRPEWKDGSLVGRRLVGGSGPSYEVVSTIAPDTIVVSGDASAETSAGFAESDGSDVLSIRDPDAEGEIGRAERRESFGVVAFANLLDDAGVDTSGSSTTGWNAVGSPTISTSTTPADVRHGDAAVQMEGGDGDAVETAPYQFAPSEDGPNLSAWISLRVVSGEVKVEIIDSQGNTLPPEDQLKSGDATLRSLSIGGEQPAAGDVKVRITALEANTDVRIDAITLTASSAPVSYAGKMGPSALWEAGVEEMIRNGGRQTRSVDGETFDLHELESVGEDFRAGDAVTVDLRGMSSIETRLERVTRQLAVGYASGAHTVRTTTERSTGVEGLLGEDSVPKPPESASQPRVAPKVDVNLDDTGTSAEVDLVVSDPSGVVQTVEFRRKKGGNIQSGQSWSDMTFSGGSYTESVGLEEKHPSQVQWRVIDIDGSVVAGQTHTFDFDDIPQASYNLTYRYDDAVDGVRLDVTCRGDEDTGSFEAVFTDADGNQETTTANGRKAVITVNPNNELGDGELFDLTVTAYSGQDATGTAETEPYDQQDLETPYLSGSASQELGDYYTKSQSDNRYVQAAGDTMTGDLQMGDGNTTGSRLRGTKEKLEVRQQADSTAYGDLEARDGVFHGDVIQEGSKFVSEAETVTVADNMGVVNSGEQGSGVTAGKAGWQVDRGKSEPYEWVFDENADRFEFGIFYHTLSYSNLSGTFDVLETVVGQSSGAEAEIWNDDGSTLSVKNKTGTFDAANGETIEGLSSGATATLSSKGTVNDRVPGAGREGSPESGGVPFWNDGGDIFATSSGLTWDGNLLYVDDQIQLGGEAGSGGHVIIKAFAGGNGAGTISYNAIDDTGSGNPRHRFEVDSTPRLTIDGSGVGVGGITSPDVGLHLIAGTTVQWGRGDNSVAMRYNPGFIGTGDDFVLDAVQNGSNGRQLGFRSDRGFYWLDENNQQLLTLDAGAPYGLQSPIFEPKQKGWRTDRQGRADFRRIYTDELVTKTFTVDLTQALAGSDYLTKSVSTLASGFSIPSNGNTNTLDVNDLPGQKGAAVFASGDWIRLRVVDNSNGGLVIVDVWGTVSNYTDNGDGTQTWDWTTEDDGGAAGFVVGEDAPVLDYGQSGAGLIERTVEGANAPFTRIKTWTTDPSDSTNYTTRTLTGNLEAAPTLSDGTDPSGYGFFAKGNAYFDGHLVAQSGKVADSFRVGENIYLWDSSASVSGHDELRISSNGTGDGTSNFLRLFMDPNSDTWGIKGKGGGNELFRLGEENGNPTNRISGWWIAPNRIKKDYSGATVELGAYTSSNAYGFRVDSTNGGFGELVADGPGRTRLQVQEGNSNNLFYAGLAGNHNAAQDKMEVLIRGGGSDVFSATANRTWIDNLEVRSNAVVRGVLQTEGMPQFPNNANLRAHYSFDARDLRDHQSGTLASHSGTEVYSDTSIFGQGLEMKGDGWITTGHSIDLTGNDAFTVIFWMRPQHVKNTFMFSDEGQGRPNVVLKDNGDVQCAVPDGSGGFTTASTNAYSAFSWYLIVARYRGNDRLSIKVFNRDGTLAGEHTFNISFGGILEDNKRDIGISGWWGDGNDEPFDGFLDEYRVYNRWVPDRQIRAFYQSPGGPGQVQMSGGQLIADTITANEIAADTITAGEIAAGAVTTDEMTIADALTLQPGGSFFAGGGQRQFAFGDFPLSQDTKGEVSHTDEGAYAERTSTDGSSSDSTTYTRTDIDMGGTDSNDDPWIYSHEVEYSIDAGSLNDEASAYVEVRAQDGNGNNLKVESKSDDVVDGGTDSGFFQFAMMLPDGTKQVEVYYLAQSSSPSDGLEAIADMGDDPNGSLNNPPISEISSSTDFFGPDGATWRSGGQVQVEINGRGNSGSQTSAAGDMYLAGTLTENSDIRSKSDVNRLETPLEVLRDIRGVTYSRRGRHEGGIPAQDLIGNFEPALRGSEKEGYGVAYSALFAPVIESIHTLDEKVIDLGDRVGALEEGQETLEDDRDAIQDEIDQLNQRIDSLKAQL